MKDLFDLLQGNAHTLKSTRKKKGAGSRSLSEALHDGDGAEDLVYEPGPLESEEESLNKRRSRLDGRSEID